MCVVLVLVSGLIRAWIVRGRMHSCTVVEDLSLLYLSFAGLLLPPVKGQGRGIHKTSVQLTHSVHDVNAKLCPEADAKELTTKHYYSPMHALTYMNWTPLKRLLDLVKRK